MYFYRACVVRTGNEFHNECGTLKTQTQTNIWNANIIQLFIISPNVANQIARVNDSEFDI